MFLRNIFINVVYYYRQAFEYLFGYNTWKIIKVGMSYIHYPVEDEDDFIFDPFWDEEAVYWHGDHATENYMDVTRDYKMGVLGDVDIPISVDDIVVCVSYVYNRRSWKYFTRNLNFVWPPPIPKNMKFNVPRKKVELLDEKGKVIVDVTGRFKKYSGPYGDFFGEPNLRPIDLFTEDFISLKIEDVMGGVYTYSLREPIQ